MESSATGSHIPVDSDTLDANASDTMKIPSTIILAAGHGGSDTGAVSPDGRHNERDQAVTIVNHAAEVLAMDYSIDAVIAPHDQDTHETIAWLNARYPWGSAWAFEIHRDWVASIKEPAASLRCGVYHGSSDWSVMLAVRLVSEFKANGADPSSWTRDQRESRFSRLGWIAQPKCLSHLVELGLVQGRNDGDHLRRLAGIFADSLAAVIAGTESSEPSHTP